MPAAQFTNQLDVGAVRQTAVIKVKSKFVRLQVFAGQIVGLPTWRIIDAQLQMAERLPPPIENISNVARQRFTQNRRSRAGRGQAWKGWPVAAPNRRGRPIG